MPRLTPEQMIEKAKQQKEKAEAQIRQATKTLKDRDRKRDTRQKVILGASLIARAKTDKYARKALMDIFRTMSERDSAVFDGWGIKDEARKPVPDVVILG